jgi:hypothetical protein
MVLSWLEGPAVTAIVDKVPTPPSFPTAVGVLLRWVASGCFTEAEVTALLPVSLYFVPDNAGIVQLSMRSSRPNPLRLRPL